MQIRGGTSPLWVSFLRRHIPIGYQIHAVSYNHWDQIRVGLCLVNVPGARAAARTTGWPEAGSSSGAIQLVSTSQRVGPYSQ
eukprot:3412168-Rhodomonas_salina.1